MRWMLGWLIGMGSLAIMGMGAGNTSRLMAAEDSRQPPATLPAGIAEIVAGKPPYEVIRIQLPKPMPGKPIYKNWDGIRDLGDKSRPPFKAPIGTVNLALSRPVTASDPAPTASELNVVTDGDKERDNYVHLAPGLQWVQIDLGRTCDIYGICVWHSDNHSIYRAVVVQVSDEPDFVNGITTIFNNDQRGISGLGLGADTEYIENYQGELMPVKNGVQGRYVRLYSKGSDNTDHNYTEVEVYGIAR